MRRGASLVAIALIAATSVAQAESRWERLRADALSWLGFSEDPGAALARRGGTRVLLGPDVDDFRNPILVELRDDARKLMREARIPWGSLEVRDGGVEVRPRDPSSLPRVLSALAATAGPAHDAVDIRETGDGVVRLVPAERALADRLNGSIDQAVDIIRRRLDAAAISASVKRDGADRILVIAPGLTEPAQLVQLIQPTARLEFRLIDLSIPASGAMQSRAPADSEVLFGFKAKEPYLVYKQSALDGRDIADARPAFNQNGQPCLDFRFTARGARVFGQLTQENVGRPFAIVLDGQVLVAPVIQTPILGGYGQITGNFTVEEANRLAVQLRAGMLPVKLNVIEQTTVAPAAKN